MKTFLKEKRRRDGIEEALFCNVLSKRELVYGESKSSRMERTGKIWGI